VSEGSANLVISKDQSGNAIFNNRDRYSVELSVGGKSLKSDKFIMGYSTPRPKEFILLGRYQDRIHLKMCDQGQDKVTVGYFSIGTGEEVSRVGNSKPFAQFDCRESYNDWLSTVNDTKMNKGPCRYSQTCFTVFDTPIDRKFTLSVVLQNIAGASQLQEIMDVVPLHVPSVKLVSSPGKQVDDMIMTADKHWIESSESKSIKYSSNNTHLWLHWQHEDFPSRDNTVKSQLHTFAIQQSSGTGVYNAIPQEAIVFHMEDCSQHVMSRYCDQSPLSHCEWVSGRCRAKSNTKTAIIDTGMLSVNSTREPYKFVVSATNSRGIDVVSNPFTGFSKHLPPVAVDNFVVKLVHRNSSTVKSVDYGSLSIPGASLSWNLWDSSDTNTVDRNVEFFRLRMMAFSKAEFAASKVRLARNRSLDSKDITLSNSTFTYLFPFLESNREYVFSLEACNAFGCSDAELRTISMPLPLLMDDVLLETKDNLAYVHLDSLCSAFSTAHIQVASGNTKDDYQPYVTPLFPLSDDCFTYRLNVEMNEYKSATVFQMSAVANQPDTRISIVNMYNQTNLRVVPCPSEAEDEDADVAAGRFAYSTSLCPDLSLHSCCLSTADPRGDALVSKLLIKVEPTLDGDDRPPTFYTVVVRFKQYSYPEKVKPLSFFYEGSRIADKRLFLGPNKMRLRWNSPLVAKEFPIIGYFVFVKGGASGDLANVTVDSSVSDCKVAFNDSKTLGRGDILVPNVKDTMEFKNYKQFFVKEKSDFVFWCPQAGVPSLALKKFNPNTKGVKIQSAAVNTATNSLDDKMYGMVLTSQSDATVISFPSLKPTVEESIRGLEYLESGAGVVINFNLSMTFVWDSLTSTADCSDMILLVKQDGNKNLGGECFKECSWVDAFTMRLIFGTTDLCKGSEQLLELKPDQDPALTKKGKFVFQIQQQWETFTLRDLRYTEVDDSYLEDMTYVATDLTLGSDTNFTATFPPFVGDTDLVLEGPSKIFGCEKSITFFGGGNIKIGRGIVPTYTWKVDVDTVDHRAEVLEYLQEVNARTDSSLTLDTDSLSGTRDKFTVKVTLKVINWLQQTGDVMITVSVDRSVTTPAVSIDKSPVTNGVLKLKPVMNFRATTTGVCERSDFDGFVDGNAPLMSRKLRWGLLDPVSNRWETRQSFNGEVSFDAALFKNWYNAALGELSSFTLKLEQETANQGTSAWSWTVVDEYTFQVENKDFTAYLYIQPFRQDAFNPLTDPEPTSYPKAVSVRMKKETEMQMRLRYKPSALAEDIASDWTCKWSCSQDESECTDENGETLSALTSYDCTSRHEVNFFNPGQQVTFKVLVENRKWGVKKEVYLDVTLLSENAPDPPKLVKLRSPLSAEFGRQGAGNTQGKAFAGDNYIRIGESFVLQGDKDDGDPESYGKSFLVLESGSSSRVSFDSYPVLNKDNKPEEMCNSDPTAVTVPRSAFSRIRNTVSNGISSLRPGSTYQFTLSASHFDSCKKKSGRLLESTGGTNNEQSFISVSLYTSLHTFVSIFNQA
jgi:hypothetical protein